MTKIFRPRLSCPGYRQALAVALLAFAATGCQSTMPTETGTDNGHHMAPNSTPLRFREHSFTAYCFNTLTCSAIYNQYDFTRLGADTPSGPPPSLDYKEHWGFASHVGIRNFPSPAEVRWTSMDGARHEARVDIGAIFKDERVLHDVPDSEIPENSFGDDPSIFLEVNDRVIHVYMKAYIPTRTEQIPGNAHSYHRTDLILAWSHTY